MKKAITLFLSAIFFSTGNYAASCTLQLSLSDYSSVYQKFGYSFIPISANNPQVNGGGQFYVQQGAAWIASSVLPWSNQTSVTVSQSKNCSAFYPAGVSNIQITYADQVNNDRVVMAQKYCLLGAIIPTPGGKTVSIPGFGAGNSSWSPC